jgi:hypothetical protein
MRMFSVVIVLLSLGANALGEEAGNLGPQLLGASPRDAHTYIMRAARQRREMVTALCRFLTDNAAALTNRDAREVAREVIDLLGDCRAPESIDTLLSVIDFTPSFVGTAPFDPRNYNAVTALAKIGPSAAEAVIEKARATTVSDGDTKDVKIPLDRMKLSLYACVIHEVFGDEMGAHYVKLKVGEDGRLELLRKAYFLQFPGEKQGGTNR